MFEKAGAPTEGLTYAEKKTAYGYKCKPVPGQVSEWTLEMTALSDRKIFVSETNGVWQAATRIGDAERARLFDVLQATGDATVAITAEHALVAQLALAPTSPGYAALAALAFRIDKYASAFWSTRAGDA